MHSLGKTAHGQPDRIQPQFWDFTMVRKLRDRNGEIRDPKAYRNAQVHDIGRVLLRLSIILGFLLTTASSSTAAENYIQLSKHGRIDWTNGFVEAFGVGRPPLNPLNAAHARAVAESNASIAARNHLMKLVKSIRVDSESLVADHVAGERISDEILEILLREARIVDLSYGHDDEVQVKVSIKLQGPLAERLLPKDILVIITVKQPQKKTLSPGSLWTAGVFLFSLAWFLSLLMKTERPSTVRLLQAGTMRWKEGWLLT